MPAVGNPCDPMASAGKPHEDKSPIGPGEIEGQVKAGTSKGPDGSDLCPGRTAGLVQFDSPDAMNPGSQR